MHEQKSITYIDVGSCLKSPKQAGHRRLRYSLGRVRGRGSGKGSSGGGGVSLRRFRAEGAEPGVGELGVGVADELRDRGLWAGANWRPRGVAVGGTES